MAKISEEQKSEMPRERLMQYGAGSLSAAELIAILLGTGTAGESVIPLSQRILQENDGLSGLMKLEHAELASIHGIGKAKAAKLKAALEMGRRLATITDADRPRVATPEDIARLYGVEMAYLPTEQLRVLMLDTRHHIIGSATIAQGSINAASVRMAEVFTPAVKRNAPYIALVHNHPTGDPTPSSADVSFTQEALKAGALLDIGVLDHVIIGQGRHASLKRLGLGFDRTEET